MKQRASEADCTRFKQMFRDRRVAEANSVGEGAARTFIDENWVNQLPTSSLLPVARALFGRGQGEYTTHTRDHHVAHHDYSASLELVGPADC